MLLWIHLHQHILEVELVEDEALLTFFQISEHA